MIQGPEGVDMHMGSVSKFWSQALALAGGLAFSGAAFAADAIPRNLQPTMSASSPFSNYTAGVLGLGILIMSLIVVMLIGGIMVVNYHLLSKREQDKTGGRTPSDLGIFKNSNWPRVPEERYVLPAEEEEDEEVAIGPDEPEIKPAA